LNVGGRPVPVSERLNPRIVIDGIEKRLRLYSGNKSFDQYFGTMRPKKVPGINIEKYNTENFYNILQVEEMVKDLRNERREYMEQFENLDSKIKEAV